MPEGSFNVSKLLAALGHKNIVEMPVSKNIQVTMPLNAMAGKTPLHAGGVALIGGFVTGIVAEFSAMAVQCLDPGGGVVQWADGGGVTEARVSPTLPIWLTGPTALTVQNFTRTPTISLGYVGTLAAPLATTPYFTGQAMPNSNYAPLWVPRGSWFVMTANLANSTRTFGVAWCGIEATEGGD